MPTCECGRGKSLSQAANPSSLYGWEIRHNTANSSEPDGMLVNAGATGTQAWRDDTQHSHFIIVRSAGGFGNCRQFASAGFGFAAGRADPDGEPHSRIPRRVLALAMAAGVWLAGRRQLSAFPLPTGGNDRSAGIHSPCFMGAVRGSSGAWQGALPPVNSGFQGQRGQQLFLWSFVSNSSENLFSSCMSSPVISRRPVKVAGNCPQSPLCPRNLSVRRRSSERGSPQVAP